VLRFDNCILKEVSVCVSRRLSIHPSRLTIIITLTIIAKPPRL